MTAILFQNMPPLSPEEYQALEASIRANGIQVPILIDETGVVIDGHHRQKIAQHLGITCPVRVVAGKTDTEKRTLALSLNLDRRHLSREQRRALVEASLKADPQLSNREHARRTGVSDKTVQTVREPLEATAEIPQLDRTVGADGKSRPASTPTTTTVDGVTVAEPRHIDPATGEVLDDRPTPEIVCTRPDPAPGPATPRKTPRRPITDQFFDAAYDLNRRVASIERLVKDERFPRNRDKVAARHHSDLVRAIDALQRVVDQLS